MKVSREEKKVEAIARLRILDVSPQTISQFREGLVRINELPSGVAYWAVGANLDRIHKFEEKYNALVFAVIRNCTYMGVIDSYLFVSDYRDEEWPTDRDRLRNYEPCAYVYNHEEPDCSEFRSISIGSSPVYGLWQTW